jgi:hypothetical protein
MESRPEKPIMMVKGRLIYGQKPVGREMERGGSHGA